MPGRGAQVVSAWGVVGTALGGMACGAVLIVIVFATWVMKRGPRL